MRQLRPKFCMRKLTLSKSMQQRGGGEGSATQRQKITPLMRGQKFSSKKKQAFIGVDGMIHHKTSASLTPQACSTFLPVFSAWNVGSETFRNNRRQRKQTHKPSFVVRWHRAHTHTARYVAQHDHDRAGGGAEEEAQLLGWGHIAEKQRVLSKLKITAKAIEIGEERW